MSSGVFTPGKVILAGEHAVVYGKMGLVANIGLGVKVRINDGGGAKNNELVSRAVELAGGNENLGVEIESELPIGSGLGSSAAVSAAVIRAVREYLGKPIGQDELFQLCWECEKLAHGNSSGADPASVVYGGLIVYIKGQPFEKLRIVKPIKLLLVNTGKPEESTKEMVELVAGNPEKERIIEAVEKLVVQVRDKLIRGEGVGELLNQNGLLLEELGVVGNRAKKLSKELREIGAHVKITGAGGAKKGSGMMIVVKDDLTQIKKLLDNRKINYLETEIGGQ